MDSIIETLLDYAITHHLMSEYDRCYARNRLLSLFKQESFVSSDERVAYTHISELLKALCDIACERGVLKDTQNQRDAFDSAIMDCVMMRPSQVIEVFKNASCEKEATDVFYAFSKDSNYIRWDRIAKNISYKVESEFGKIDITINCSKPEKDPKDIANAKFAKQSDYPTCVLCKENEGYYGNQSRDGRSNIRLIPLHLCNENWYFQYSPYVYYNEHCIVLSGEHVPMKTCRKTFERLLSFVDVLPHYFLGANADLPIVGGSILSHDHYQGGNYTFAMADASVLEEYDCFRDRNIQAQRLHWPLSVLRLRGNDMNDLIDACTFVLDTWRGYDDEACDILSHTNEDHNTISTIVRKKDTTFEVDLVLRNNRRSEAHPLGIFHPHEEIHHIKKENIGIIEVMGLAVLPARLKEEMKWIEDVVLHNDQTHVEALSSHKEWIHSLKQSYTFTNDNVEEILKAEVGKIFIEGLKHCGVYKLDDTGRQGFARFIKTIEHLKEEQKHGN